MVDSENAALRLRSPTQYDAPVGVIVVWGSGDEHHERRAPVVGRPFVGFSPAGWTPHLISTTAL